MTADEPKSLRHSLAGLSRWAGVDPDARAEHMRMMQAKAAEKREAERAEREARGEVSPKPKRRTRSVEPLPPVADLLPLMGDIQRERAEAGLPELAAEPLMREASLRIRRAIAKSTFEAMKGES
jgi:hypothetical protein